MQLINENEVKRLINEKGIPPKGELTVTENQLFTPSAIEYINDKNIKIIKKDLSEEASANKGRTYETVFGGIMVNKPEHMTHLSGNTLVFKDHPVIKYRGALDSLESEIIYAQTIISKNGYSEIVEDLEEVIRLVRLMIKVQITGEKLNDFTVMGLNDAELREHSHHSTKYYGISHFLPSYKQGEVAALINRLRTLARKTELIAYDTFKNADKNVSRNDIIKALNRLSSAFWIMLCKYLSGKYKKD